MSDNSETLRKEFEENKDSWNLSNSELQTYEAVLRAIENKPRRSLPPIPVILMMFATALGIIGSVITIIQM